jgi:uncharacterized protein
LDPWQTSGPLFTGAVYCRMLRSFVVRSLALVAVTLTALPAQAQSGSQSFLNETAAWRRQHVAELTKPDGWLSLAGLAWLEPGDNSFGSRADNKILVSSSAPAQLGILRLVNDTVSLVAPSGGFPEGFLLDGQPASAQTLRVVGNKDKLSQHLTIGPLNLYVIRRENRFGLRIKDAHSAALRDFDGLRWFPPNEHYRITAKWIPYTPPKAITLATLVGTKYDQPVPGAAEFSLNGKTYRLEPVLEDPEQPKLFFILRDTTSRTSTYGACRFLYTGFPSNGLPSAGELVLDFNRLENPPCAYTPFSTCPLPPPGNRLPIALPVGEKRYHH